MKQCGSNPGGGTRSSAPVQSGPGAHPDSYTMGTGAFLGVKWPGCGTDHPPTSTAEVKKEIRALHLLALWAFVVRSMVTFTFTFMYVKNARIIQNSVRF
jgi:hypothetical protein